MSTPEGGRRRGLPPAAAGIPVPADKRFRRSGVRPGRRRSWRAILVRLGWFGGAGLVALLLAAWAGSAFVNAAVLQVDHVVVRGNARLSTADIEARIDGLRHQSILRVDLEQFRRRLLESPWVASAELWRVLPSTVHVRVVERTPLAVARLHGRLHLVDAAGVVIDSFGPRYRDLDLPIVDGLVTDARGATVDAERIQLVQRVFQELSSARPDLFRRLSQLDVADPRNAVVLLDGEPAELRLGDRDFAARLKVYEDVAPEMRAQRTIREYYELRFGDRLWAK